MLNGYPVTVSGGPKPPSTDLDRSLVNSDLDLRSARNFSAQPRPLAPGTLRAPAFFSEDRAGAEWYCVERGETARLIEAHLAIRHPFFKTSWESTCAFVQIALEAGIALETDIMTTPRGWSFFCADIQRHSPYEGTAPGDLVYIPAFREALAARGCDGVFLYDALEAGEIPTWIALDPSTQVRIQRQTLHTPDY